jgi:hypothetical protein
VNGEEIGILNQLRPIIRRFVSTVKDYSKYVELSKMYAGKLDPAFICGITKILSAIEKDIRQLIGYRWYKATQFLDDIFHQSMIELEEKAKVAVYGNFSKDFPNLFKKLLEVCYTFIKLIRSHFESNTIHSNHCGDLISPGTNSHEDTESGSYESKRKGGNHQLKRTKTTGPKQTTGTKQTTQQPQPQTIGRQASKTQQIPVASPIARWRCFKCTFVNTKGDKCNMCGEGKPIMYEMVSSPSTKKEIDLRVNKKWICPCCKFINTSANLDCQMCNQPNTLNQKTWICSYCSASNSHTVTNSNTITKCFKCDKSKPRLRSVSSPHLEGRDLKLSEPPNILNNITNHNSFAQRTKTTTSRKKVIPFSQANVTLKNNYY